MFLSACRTGGVFHVVARKIDNSGRIASLTRLLDESPDIEPSSCGIDASSTRHAKNIICENYYYYSDFEEGCAVERNAKLRQQIDTLEWTPALLDYFWQHGIERDGLQFLGRAGFVWLYK